MSHIHARVLLALALMVLAPPAPPQLQFAELGKSYMPPNRGESTHEVATGDVDGDGDLDVVFANGIGDPSHLLLNDGSGMFVDVTTARLLPQSQFATRVVLGDLDADGDLDLVLGTAVTAPGLTSYLTLYRNDGSGTFTDATVGRIPAISVVWQFTRIALADVDGDRDPDLLVGSLWSSGVSSGMSQTQLWLNDGSARFTDVTATHMPLASESNRGIALADVDGDGDPDLLCANNGQSRLYSNDGSGVFVDTTSASLPILSAITNTAIFGDVDADGDQDLVLGNDHAQKRLYVNDGRGVFLDVTASRMPIDMDATLALELRDVDGDLDVDLLIGNSLTQNRLYLNDGAGTFTDATAALPARADATTDLALGDVDADGDADLIVAEFYQAQNRLQLNDGYGHFLDTTAPRLPSDTDSTSVVAAGDVNGDGTPDLVFGGSSGNRLYENDGFGLFRDVSAEHLPVAGGTPGAIALGDVDGDEDLDLVFGNYGRERLYLNRRGTFKDASAERLPVDGNQTEGVAVGDVDCDGDLDLLVGNLDDQNRLYLNDGTGFFVDVSASKLPPAQSNGALVLGDVDGDGDLDVALSGGTSGTLPTRLYLNDGSGAFQDATGTHLPAAVRRCSCVALGDVDGDGDLDLLLGSGSGNRILINDGSGGFADETTSRWANPYGGQAVALGDVDLDGDLDLVQANYGTIGGTDLFLNDGAGVFANVAAARVPSIRSDTLALALVDLDRDSDLDVALANGVRLGLGSDPTDRVYWNLLRQLETPRFAIAGQPYQVDFYARYGIAHARDVVLPLLAVAPGRLPLPPFGTLRLDPALMIALPPLEIPNATGVASLSFVLPNDPAFVGITLHDQAILVQDPVAITLTNALRDDIVR